MEGLPMGLVLADRNGGPCLPCTTSALKYQRINDACLISKLKDSNSGVRPAIRRTCARIACDPTLLQKLRFD